MKRGKKIPYTQLGRKHVRCPRCGELGAEVRYCDHPANKDRPPAVVVKHEGKTVGGWMITLTKVCAFKTLKDYEEAA